MRRLTILSTCLIGATACTAVPPNTASLQPHRPEQCFWASQIRGFSDAGPDRALVRIRPTEIWELTVAPGCPDVNWAMRIGIVSRGSQRICTGRPAELVVPTASGSSSQRCLVRSVRKLSPEEAAAARGLTPAR